MAAPMNMLSSRILMQYIKVCQFRIFDRGLKRQPKKALSKEKEVNILRRKKIGLDPRKNPYVPFEAKDPVQKNLVELANSKGNTMTAKVIDQKLLRKDQGVNYRNKKSGTKMEVMSSASGAYTKLADSDKQFGYLILSLSNLSVCLGSQDLQNYYTVVLIQTIKIIRKNAGHKPTFY